MSVVDDGIGFLGPVEWSLPTRVAKPCDSCAATAAVVHCRAHAAFLCVDCDGRVHGGVGGGHERVWMCDVCEQAPAAVTCKADAAALCVSCDADIHSANPLARRHDRVPVVPFYEPALSAVRRRAAPGDYLGGNGCESEGEEEAAETVAGWAAAPPSPKLKPVDFFFDPLLDVDYYSSPIDAGYGLIETPAPASTVTTATADSVVPVQSKIDASPLTISRQQQISFDIDYYSPKNHHGYNFTITNTSQTMSCPSLDVGVVPDSNSRNISFSNGGGSASYGGVDSTGAANTSVASAVGMDREARVLRYREKRKNRKFEKTIRYASRKAYAESRPRIKGRFAKRAESANEVDGIYSTAAALLIGDGFGIVPTF